MNESYLRDDAIKATEERLMSVIESGEASMYDAQYVLQQKQEEATGGGTDGARDETLQRCFAELISAMGDAKRIQRAIRASRISSEAHDEFAAWCLLFHETVSREQTKQKDIAARARAVAEMAELAAKAKREAAALERQLLQERRTFETDFGRAPEQPDATGGDQEDEEERQKIMRSINRYIGNDAPHEGAAAPPLTHKVFTRLNAATDTPVPKERFHAHAPVTIKSLRENKKKRDGGSLAPGEWEAYKQRIKARCESAGRVMVFNDFCKQNGEYATSRGVSRNELWKQYNETWDALCGIALKRVGSTDRPKKKAASPKKTEEEQPLESSHEEEEAGGEEEEEEDA